MDARFDQMDARFAQMEARFDRMDDRLYGLHRTLLTVGGGMIAAILVSAASVAATQI